MDSSYIVGLCCLEIDGCFVKTCYGYSMLSFVGLEDCYFALFPVYESLKMNVGCCGFKNSLKQKIAVVDKVVHLHMQSKKYCLYEDYYYQINDDWKNFGATIYSTCVLNYLNQGKTMKQNSSPNFRYFAQIVQGWSPGFPFVVECCCQCLGDFHSGIISWH